METGENTRGEWGLFLRMASTFPVRTLIFSFGLPIFAFVQVINAYVNQAHIGIIVVFTLATIAFSVSLTRYQLAIYRRRLISEQVYQSPGN